MGKTSCVDYVQQPKKKETTKTGQNTRPITSAMTSAYFLTEFTVVT
jgi:hypothetical protein